MLPSALPRRPTQAVVHASLADMVSNRAYSMTSAEVSRNKRLKTQLDGYMEHLQTDVDLDRKGGRVKSSTAESRLKHVLLLLGFVHHRQDVMMTSRQGGGAASSSAGVFRLECALQGEAVSAFYAFLRARGRIHGRAEGERCVCACRASVLQTLPSDIRLTFGPSPPPRTSFVGPSHARMLYCLSLVHPMFIDLISSRSTDDVRGCCVRGAGTASRC